MDQSLTRSKQLTAALPEGLLQRVVDHLNPIKVIVFGSHARGDAGPDSDWDLLIVVDDEVPKSQIDWHAVHETRRGIRGAIDLIPCRVSSFQERADIIGSLPWIASTEGVVVYDRPQAD
jgi:predicted nucleotidyltransferase